MTLTRRSLLAWLLALPFVPAALRAKVVAPPEQLVVKGILRSLTPTTYRFPDKGIYQVDVFVDGQNVTGPILIRNGNAHLEIDDLTVQMHTENGGRFAFYAGGDLRERAVVRAVPLSFDPFDEGT